MGLNQCAYQEGISTAGLEKILVALPLLLVVALRGGLQVCRRWTSVMAVKDLEVYQLKPKEF